MAASRSVLLLVGCALAAPAAAPAQERQTEWGRVQFDRDLGLTTGAIAAPMDSAWLAMKHAIEEAGIPITVEDRATARIGNPQFRAVRRLGRTVLSRYFSCGEGAVGPNANHYHVFINLIVGLTPAPDRQTRFELQLRADAVDVPNGRPERLPCGTTGRLELELVRRLDARFPGTQ